MSVSSFIAFFALLCELLLCRFPSSTLYAQVHQGENELKLYLERKEVVEPGDTSISFRLTLKKKHAQADLSILKQAMEEAHPGIYRYKKQNEIDALFKTISQKFKDSVPYLQFTSCVAEILNAIGCVHSGWQHAEFYQRIMQEMKTYFPFDVTVLRRNVFITGNNGELTKVPLGSRIIALNGMKIENILKRLRYLLPHEGNNRTYIDRQIDEGFYLAFSSFIDNPSNFNISYVPPGGRTIEQADVPAISLEQIDQKRKVRRELNSADRLPLTFTFNDTISTGIYTIEWFNEHFIKSKGQDFLDFTDSVFSELNSRKAQNLIIDIRDNGGGLTAYGKKLFSYFIDKTVPYFESVLITKASGFFFEPLITSRAPYNDTMSFVKTANKKQLWINNPNLIAEPARNNRFRGKTYILINGNTMSCSSIFAAAMRLRTNAIFIGEESGGVMGGPNGMPVWFRLPYSKVNVGLSTAQYTNGGNPQPRDRGVIPNFQVDIPIADKLSGNDTIMNFTLALITKFSSTPL